MKEASPHNLTEVDRASRLAQCSICGPMRIYIKPSTGEVRCHNARRREWERARLKKYGLTLERFNALPGANGQCPICLRSGLVMYVDHDHSCCPDKGSCGQCVRGILCADCNLSLGRFRDEIPTILRAIAYLQAG